MREASYVFEGAAHDAELARLRLLESIFDEATRRALVRAGLERGWRCLEIGAGAGSVAAWMREYVGTEGHIVAVDIDARFLSHLAGTNVEVHEADIRSVELPAASFDVAHARFVFLHQSKWREALEATLRLLRPGGHLVLEEPDFSVSRAIAGAGHRRDAFERVHRAIEAMFSESGMSFDFGARLPAIFQEYQLEDLAIANDVPIVRGGTPFARMMGMSTQQLGNKYVATGVATKRDLELYWDFAHDPNSWAIYHGTVRASGRLAARTP